MVNSIRNKRKRVYLDHAATTPVDPRVLDAMLPYFTDEFGNPASIHTFGQQAEYALDTARQTISEVLSCSDKEVIFTSGGSESDNLAIRGIAYAAREKRNANHILTTKIEHPAVTKTVEQLTVIAGFDVEYLPVDHFGRVDPADVEQRLREDTALVSIMYANNEVGTINPIVEIGTICKRREVPFHTDAVQAAAYLPIDVNLLGMDALSIGAHKLYGPKGVGALYLREGTAIIPALTGGSQEFGLRAGTSNIPYIVGLAEAMRLTHAERASHIRHVLPLRAQIIDRVVSAVPEAELTGHPDQRMPNHASFVFRGVDGNALVAALDVEGYACSSGSACKTGDPEPSAVLTTLGYERDMALGSLRITLGTQSTQQDVEAFLAALPEVIARNRQLISRS
jgi:cysteine desulfurase